MTKKHFQTLAEHIRMIMDPAMRLNAAVAVASACQAMNPNFKPDRFYRACGIVPEAA